MGGHPELNALVGEISTAVSESTVTAVCARVKAALTARIDERACFLEKGLLAPRSDRYARNLVHRDPLGRFSVITMVWSPGQGTPIHDHGGLWCVECVYQGRIRVRSYRPGPARTDGSVRFEETETIVAGAGEAGHLIPPFDYHVIDNPFGGSPAATVHVYGGDMEACRIFEPLEDGFHRPLDRKLSFDGIGATRL